MTTETEPDPAPPSDVAADRRVVAQRRGFLPAFLLAVFGSALVLNTTVTVSLPVRMGVLAPESKETWLAIAIAVGGAAVMLVTPPLGMLSDASSSRFGTRRPFLVVGPVVGTVGMVLIALTGSPVTVVAGWCLAQLGFASAPVAVNALLAEAVPTRIRARVSAAYGIAQSVTVFAGGFLVSTLPPAPIWWFAIPSLVAIVTNTALAMVLRDTVLRARRSMRLREILASYWVDPRRHRDFAFGWLCRLLVTLGIVTVVVYLLYYLTDVIGVPVGEAPATVATMLGLYVTGSILTTFVFGWLSDRTGRRKMMVFASSMLTAVGLGVCLVAGDLTVFGVGIAIAGLGQGAYLSVDMALMTEVLPADIGAGHGLGVIALAYQLPQLLAPVLAIPLLAIGDGGPNYAVLYGGAIVATALGGLAVLPIRGVR